MSVVYTEVCDKLNWTTQSSLMMSVGIHETPSVNVRPVAKASRTGIVLPSNSTAAPCRRPWYFLGDTSIMLGKRCNGYSFFQAFWKLSFFCKSVWRWGWAWGWITLIVRVGILECLCLMRFCVRISWSMRIFRNTHFLFYFHEAFLFD